MPEQFEARYRTSLEDWRTTIRRMRGRRLLTRLGPYLIWSYSVVVCVAGGFIIWSSALIPGLACLICGFVFPLFYYCHREWHVRRSYRQQRLDQEIAIAVSDEGVAFSHCDGSGNLRWAGFLDSEVIGDLVLIWRNEMQVLTIPKSAFKDHKTAERFAAFVREKISATKT